jgi:hypothetical protein
MINKEGCCGCGCGVGVLLVTIVVLCGALFLIAQGNMPQAPSAAFTPNPFEANQFDAAIQQAQSSAIRSGNFSVADNEAQASSWLNLRAESVAYSDIPLDNMQIRFRDGSVVLYGEVKSIDFTTVSAEIGIALAVAADGSLQVTIVDSNFGGIGVPGGIQDDISQQIQEGIDRELRRVDQAYQLTSIGIGNGTLTISGRVVN